MAKANDMFEQIDDMSQDELKALKKRVDHALETVVERKKEAARKQLEEHAREMGFKLEDLLETKPRKARKTVAPKYRNPEDPEQTWTGRGRKPKWVEAYLDNGGSLDAIAIDG